MRELLERCCPATSKTWTTLWRDPVLVGITDNAERTAVLDTRNLTFSPVAMCALIAQSPVAAETLGLPAALPSGIRFRPDQATADVVYGKGAMALGYNLSTEALGALIIAYCRRVRIPLPRASRKAITVHQDRIVLTVVTEIAHLPAPSLPETATGVRRQLRRDGAIWIDPRSVWLA
jgi:hypothetical protein